ncbi:MAG: alanine racemase [Anaerovoracaceae bacterium]|jgi:alanine racemase
MEKDFSKRLSYEAKWVEVDLDALAFNIKSIRAKVGDKRFCAVVKANAEGNGVEGVINTFLENGTDQFAVSSLNEALELRRFIPEDIDVLVLGNMPYGSEEVSINANLQHAITSYEKAELLSKTAVKLGKKAKCHIAVDTGMTRIGFMPDEKGAEEVVRISKLPGLDLEGIFTHYARADEADKYWAKKQWKKYTDFVDLLASKGITFRIRHTSNSAAIMELPETYCDMVRPGIILYGIYPSSEVLPENLEIKPVMTWKTRITHVKTLEEDRQVGYGGKYTAHAGDKIATLAIGYADGYTRAQSGHAEVLYKGKRVPIRGNICMDQCMIDVTGFDDVKVGDEVVLMGVSGDEFISADEIAARYNTIGYEVVCAVNRRVPRYYFKDGKLVNCIDYLER